MNDDAIIIGYSGHAYVLLDVLITNGISILGYCEKELKTNNPYNLNYLGTESDSEVLRILKQHHVFLGIGNNNVRAMVFKNLVNQNVICPSIVHQKAIVSLKSAIGRGTVVMPGAIINSGAKIGDAVICNSASVIEHECIIGNFVHIAPGAVLAGNVTVGENTFVGANTVIKQGITVGASVIIGAGSVVVKDIPDNVTVYGNPAKAKVL